MKRSMMFLGVLVTLLVAVAAVVPAQSLLDNEFYRKAKTLQAQSEQAFQDGDYDQAASLAQQAKENLAKSDEYVTRMTLYYTANGWLARANDRLTFAKSIKADVNYKEAYDKAASDIAYAKAAFDAGQYEDSTQLSKDALAALEGIQRVTEAPAPEPEPQAGTTLPLTYTVRLIPSLRDCLWRIAGYPFVYNNPWRWKDLYAANKSILKDPNNPNLIYPGQVLTIPSIKGETREGAYDPEQTYEPLP
jgi:nucleoid-associated protein YgaU